MTKTSSIRKLAAPALVTAASLALSVSALGATRPDDRAGLRGPGGTGTPQNCALTTGPGIRGAGVVAPTTLRPDDRPGVREIEPPSVASRTASPLLGTDGGFDWSTAGAGAGSATGLIVLLGAAALTLRRSHRRAGTAA